MTAVLTDEEIEAVRRRLGYGNILIGGEPYTPDGFLSLFVNVIAVYLSTAEETTATTAITANSITVVTPVSMTGIAANVRLIVDVAEDAEIVVVKATTLTTFTARFAKAHTTAGYPIAVQSGLAMLRYLLHQADLAWQKMLDTKVGNSAGLKQLARGDIEWFGPGWVLKELVNHYRAIVWEIARLIRVAPLEGCGQIHQLEAY